MSSPVSHLVLYQYPPIPGSASISPFCMKVHYALKLKGLAYEVKNEIFAGKASSEGKLPVLAIDGEKVLDSTIILRRLEAMAPAPRLVPEGVRERAMCDLYEDWADETLYWHMVQARWGDAENFARLAPVFFASFPFGMRTAARVVGRAKMRRQLAAVGIGRRAREVVRAELDHELDVLDGLLDGRDYLLGSDVTIADLAVVAQLQCLRVGLTPAEEKVVAGHRVTSAYLDRVLSRAATD